MAAQTGSSKSSILSLDKSEESWPAQLTKACDILSIDLDAAWKATLKDFEVKQPEERVLSDPRIEWTLRWLLKRFQPVDGRPSSPCEDFKAWVFLTKLVDGLPHANLARILNAQEFNAVLRITLQSLREKATQASEDQISEAGAAQSAEHSRTESVKSALKGPKASQKRKREEMEPQNPTLFDDLLDVDTLFLAVSTAIYRLEGLARTLPGNQEDFAPECMKNSLKSTPEAAAQNLGNAFYLANRLVRTSNRAIRGNFPSRFDKSKVYKICITPITRLWDLRNFAAKGSNSSSDNAYACHCMLPSLQLLDTCRNWQGPEAKLESITITVESLLVKHVILPARTFFIEIHRSVNAHDTYFPALSRKNLAKALKEYAPPPTGVRRQKETKVQTYLLTRIISFIFEIAIRARPRGTPKLRRLEDEWLRKLFAELAECAPDILFCFKLGRAAQDRVRCLEWMLQNAVDQNVQLTSSSLQRILENSAGLFPDDQDIERNEVPKHDNHELGDHDHQIYEEKNHTRWNLSGLCLLKDANIFIIPSPNHSKDQRYSYRPPNKYLAALLAKLTGDSCKPRPDFDTKYDLKLSRIILPLMTAFVDARDLTGFMEHWREQLAISQERRVLMCQKRLAQCQDQPELETSNELRANIWADDKILHATAALVESALTAGQIETLLRTAHAGLDYLDSEYLTPDFAANLVILDCIYIGIHREDTLGKLANETLSIFRSLQAIVCNAPNIPQSSKWRVWTIMTGIVEGWPSLHDDKSFRETARSAFVKANELLESIASREIYGIESSYLHKLNAFRFMLSFAPLDRPFWDGLEGESSRKIIATAMGRILELKKRFCEQIRWDVPGLIRPSVVSIWTGASDQIRSIDAFYIGCISQALMSTYALDCLDDKLLELLISSLYSCAVYRRRSAEVTQPQHFDYDWLWGSLLNAPILEENARVATCLRKFQANQYVNVLGSSESKFWEVNSVEYTLAFESLQRASVSKFTPEEQTKVANRILRVLLYTNLRNARKMTEHIELLTTFVENKPIEPIDVFKDDAGTSEETLSEQRIEKGSVLTVIMDKVEDLPWSTEIPLCMAAFRRLTQKIMRHFFSDFSRDSNVNYLRSLYKYLDKVLEDAFAANKSDIRPQKSFLFEIALNMYSEYELEIPEPLISQLQTIDELRQKDLFSLQPGSYYDSNTLRTPRARYEMGGNLECLIGYADILSTHPNLWQISESLFVSFSAILEDLKDSAAGDVETDWEPCGVDYLRARLARLEYRLGAMDESLHPCFAETARILENMGNPNDKATLLHYFQQILTSLGARKRVDLIIALVGDGQDPLNPSVLALLRIILLTFEEQHTEAFGPALAQLFTILSETLLSSKELHPCILSMQCLYILLQRQRRIISQWHIDSLLSAFAVKSSQLEPLKDRQSATQYTGLCRLFGAILANHRKKTGGRYHLVVLALQGLLRCLFVPYKITETAVKNPYAYTKMHASAYARLLTRICDPSVSAVTRSVRHFKLDLSDETKKAQSIAGQHLPYLIMEYCDCRLKARISPEMKAALDPGLYAVLGVMSQEVMRTMNAGMDESRRAVFKVLYDDWSQFGRWKGG